MANGGILMIHAAFFEWYGHLALAILITTVGFPVKAASHTTAD